MGSAMKTGGRMKHSIKQLFYHMHKHFPNGRISQEVVRKVIVTEIDRRFMEKYGFLVKEKMGNKTYYNLGPNSLQLVSSWKTEKLTSRILKLTVLILFIALSSLLFPIIQNALGAIIFAGIITVLWWVIGLK